MLNNTLYIIQCVCTLQVLQVHCEVNTDWTLYKNCKHNNQIDIFLNISIPYSVYLFFQCNCSYTEPVLSCEVVSNMLGFETVEPK